MTTQHEGMSIEQARRFVRKESSRTRRIIYAALLAFDAGVLVLLVTLWSTESGLPARTHLAFGVMTAGASAWLAFFGWVLMRRRPLFAMDRVIAGRLSLVFTTLFLVGGVLIAARRAPGAPPLTVVGVGGIFVAASAVMLAGAIRTRRALLRRRGELFALTSPSAPARS